MVTYCVAYNCNNSQVKGSNASFHRFPKDKTLRKRWIAAIKRKHFNPTSTSTLCSDHFAPDAFTVRPNEIKRTLKRDAVPTIFNFPNLSSEPSRKHRRVLSRIQEESPNEDLCINTTDTVDGSSNELVNKKSIDTFTTQQCPPQSSSESQNTTVSSNVQKSPTKTLLRRKIKILQQRLKRRDLKITTMKELILSLKAKIKDCEDLLEILQSNFAGFPMHVLLNKFRNKEKGRSNVYSEKMREFALTLYFYSPKAYKYVRSLNFGLPNPSTLRRWVSKFNCSPGFLKEVFHFLNVNVEEKSYLQNVSLVFDSMAIRKQIIYDDKEGKTVGYVDLGGCNVENQEDLATEALLNQTLGQ